MAQAGLGFIEVARVNTYMAALQDVRLLPNELWFLSKTKISDNVDDSEIIGSYSGYVQIADLVADDAAAVTYDFGKLNFESYTIPNIKHGINYQQSQINQLRGLNRRAPAAGRATGRTNTPLMFSFQERISDALLLGIRQRMEAMIVAMHVDGMSYDRLGIKLNNISWGMPADLKITLTGTATWDSPATATPVANINGVRKIARIRYGVDLNRMVLTQTAFDHMTSTTEFQNKSRMFLAPNVSWVNIDNTDTQFLLNLARNVMGLKEIVIYDSRAWSRNGAGQVTNTAFLAAPKVVLQNTGDDNNGAAMDFANAEVTESIVGSMARTNIVGTFSGPQTGPVAYVTVPPDLNPPRLTHWGVARGFPRKFIKQATACLTVGAFTDSISVGPPY